MKLSHKIGTAALTAAIAIGGTTAAFAGSDAGGAGTTKAEKIAFLCAHKDEIVPKLTERQTHLTERLAKLTALDTKATAAGKTEVAARVETRIAKVQERLDKVGTKLEKAPAWIAANCTG